MEDFNGNYPTFMSLNTGAGHLATSGYVFYMAGCPGGPTIGERRFSTRVFTITTGTFSLCDVNQDGMTDVSDVQELINIALGSIRGVGDLNQDGIINVVDVQIVINAVLGSGCGAT